MRCQNSAILLFALLIWACVISCWDSPEKQARDSALFVGEVVLDGITKNAQIRIDNDRLENEIAVLHGKRQDKKRLAIDEKWLSDLREVWATENDLKLAPLIKNSDQQEQVDKLRVEIYGIVDDENSKVRAVLR